MVNINKILDQGVQLDFLAPTPENLEAIGTFFATNSISENISRIFNNTMFAIVGLQLALAFGKCIPKIKNKIRQLEEDFSELPVISTLIKYKIHYIPSILVARKVLAIAIGYIVYPAIIMAKGNNLNPARRKLIRGFEKIGYKIQAINLNKNGINYDAFIVGAKENLTNGNWVQVAGGNGFVGEQVIPEMANRFKGQNILYINGPGVARSGGYPTGYAIGAGQEAGLQLLEKMGAKKVLVYGTSLGGGAIANAFSNHAFKKDVEYLVWSDRSFSKLSDAAGAMVSPIVKFIFTLLGVELDGVAGAKRLNQLGIPQLITNNYNGENINGILPKIGPLNITGTDGVIPNIASLYTGVRNILNKLANPDLIQFFGYERMAHNGSLGPINELVFNIVNNFFEGKVASPS